MIYYVKSGMTLDPYERKRKRVYGRILSGVVFAKAHHQKLYFLTLTSSTLSGIYTLSEAFNLLVKMIRKKYGFFEYCYIRTSEGNGVIHCLFKSIERISVDFIRMYWDHFRHSRIFKLEESYGSLHDLTSYLVGYLSNNPISRFVMSSYWIFPSWTWWFNDTMSDDKLKYPERIAKWNNYLKNYDSKGLYSKRYLKQVDLNGHFHANRITTRNFSIAIGFSKNPKAYFIGLGLS